MDWIPRHRVVARAACAALAGLLAGRAARAEAEDSVPLAREGAPALPFSDADLEGALLARLLRPPPGSAAAPVARVEGGGAGTVVVQVGDETRVVRVGERTGAAAARVVALVIADMLSVAPVAGPPAAPVAPTSPPLLGPTPAIQTEAPPAPAVRPGRLCVTAGASKGTGAQELLATDLNVDLELPISRTGWRWSPSASLVVMPTRNTGTLDEVSFLAGVARLLAGRAWGPAEVLAGPFASAYRVSGATAHSGVLFGGEAMARLAAPLSSHLRLVVDGRADVYANRVRVHWVDRNAYATPRFGLSVGAGLAWDWSS